MHKFILSVPTTFVWKTCNWVDIILDMLKSPDLNMHSTRVKQLFAYSMT